MHQFVLEEHLEIMCSKSGKEMEEFMALARDDFISTMLRMHAANSCRKRRLLIKNAKMEKSDLTLSTYVQYVEDFRFWMNVAGRTHRLPDKKIAKCFVSGLKPDVFREEMYSRSFGTLEDIIREAHEDLSTYRDILEISDRIKKVESTNVKRNFLNPGKIFRQRFQIL